MPVSLQRLHHTQQCRLEHLPAYPVRCFSYLGMSSITVLGAASIVQARVDTNAGLAQAGCRSLIFYHLGGQVKSRLNGTLSGDSNILAHSYQCIIQVAGIFTPKLPMNGYTIPDLCRGRL